jgi:hypothetical protein
MGHLEEPPTFTVLMLTPPQATMKIARIRGYVLIARVLFARIFIAGRGFNGTILSVYRRTSCSGHRCSSFSWQALKQSVSCCL